MIGIAGADQPGEMTRRYAPGTPRSVNRLTQSCSSSQPGERPAGDARGRDLEHTGAANLPALADECAVDVEAGGGQVLAEDSVASGRSEVHLPRVEIFAGNGVHRLVRPAMGLRWSPMESPATLTEPGFRVLKQDRVGATVVCRSR